MLVGVLLLSLGLSAAYPLAAFIIVAGSGAIWAVHYQSAGQRGRRLLGQAKKEATSKPQLALRHLAEADGLVPNSRDVLRTALEVATNAELLEEAVPWGERLVEMEPDNLDAAVALGNALYRVGRFDEAIKVLQHIPEESELFTGAVLLLGGAFSAKGDNETAIETFRRGPLRKRKLDRPLLELHYQLGWHYEKVGDKKLAQRHYRRVYSVDATYRDVAERMGEEHK